MNFHTDNHRGRESKMGMESMPHAQEINNIRREKRKHKRNNSLRIYPEGKREQIEGRCRYLREAQINTERD